MLGQRAPRGLALVFFVAACGRGTDRTDGTGAGPAGEVLVSAAASLTDAFGDIEVAFEVVHPGVDVLLNLGGSSSLQTQILDGAPIDVFASANHTTMGRVVEAGAVTGQPRVFARNRLQIAVPAGNPAAIDGLEDLADPALRIGLCAAAVPCGDLARRVLSGAGIVPSLDTSEPNARALLTKVELGELDGAVTYVTDVTSTKGTVRGIDVAELVDARTEYPIAVLASARNRDAAEAFVRFVLSAEGRAILMSHGFEAP